MEMVKIMANFNFKKLEERFSTFLNNPTRQVISWEFSTCYIPNVPATKENPQGLNVQYSVCIRYKEQTLKGA